LTYIEILLSFIKIGLFSFGGGYAMIPLIQKEIENHGWLTSNQFVDIISIAEMTPGPIAVNSATFVGYKVAGIFGGIIATIGVAMPSFILVLLVSKYFFKFQEHSLNKMIFYGIRPVITGLIFSASIFVAQTAFFNEGITMNNLISTLEYTNNIIDFKSILIFALTIISITRFKLNPILTIAGSGILGIILYSFI